MLNFAFVVYIYHFEYVSITFINCKTNEKFEIIYLSENTLYHFYGMNSKDSKLLDGDKNTSEENEENEPYILVQLKNFTTIKQLYVHLELGKLVFFHRNCIKENTLIITL